MSDKIQYGAEMTFKQFFALTNYLNFHDLLEETKTNNFYNKVTIAKNVNPNEVKKWIFNGWNTEGILRVNDKYLEIGDNYFALQCSFPQAYYSVFMLTLAYMTLNGQNTTSHAGIIDKFSEYAAQGKYPRTISFHCKGTKKNPEFVHIKKHPSTSTLELNYKSKESCETQICQFLNSTRQFILDEKRNDKNVAKSFTTGQGKSKKQKKNLSESNWPIVANKIKETNILHLLYRKRIKSNYREIDAFIYENLKADYINKCLIGIVENLNFVHEMYIYKMLGTHKYFEFYEEYTKGQALAFLDQRIEKINNEL